MYHCILNPQAGRGDGPKFLPFIKESVKNDELDIKITTGPNDAVNFAKEAVESKSQGIIAVGGDGTVQEIVTGMLSGRDKCDIPLKIISCGSGNDLKRSLNRLNKLAIKDVEDAGDANDTHYIDAIRVGERACLNIANIGLDAKIVYNARRFKRFFGKNAYVLSAIISIAGHKNIPLVVNLDDGSVKLDDSSVKNEFTLVAICNGQYYGGNMRIAPSAQIDDGLITLCMIDSLSKLKALTLFPLVLMDRHAGLKPIRYTECKKVSITTNGPQTLCLDGNLYECEGLVEFEILPSAIRVVVD